MNGEDLIVRTPDGETRIIQMKERPTVNWKAYGKKEIWMLFPDPKEPRFKRTWFCVEHDVLFAWFNAHTKKPRLGYWHRPSISKDMRAFLQPYTLTIGDIDG